MLRFFSVLLTIEKNEKNRKTDAIFTSTGRVGGLAEAAGKVRKGNPSGTGRLNASVQNHGSTPLGYGELRTLRETAALRKGMLRMGYASDCRFDAKGVRKTSFEKLFCGKVSRSIASFFWPRKCHKNAPTNIAKQFQIHPKITEFIPNPLENR